MNDLSPTTTELAYVALRDLTISPLNTRQTVADADIEAMAQSIATVGLLQNLMGHQTDDSVQIVAGGKRLRALELLADTADSPMGPDSLIPVRVTMDETTAREWAGTENEARSDPHPADQIRAYRDMAAKGAEPAVIARAFAKTENHVRGRLKLAQLPDTALTALREGKINLDEAKALTLASDPAQLDRVLEAVTTQQHWSASRIRRELAEGKIEATDRRVKFIGLDLYIAEGGALTADLFTDASLLHDVGLLDKLFATKLALKAEQVERDEGWSWVKALREQHTPFNWYDTHKRLHPEPGTLSEADTEEYDRLAELAEADAINDTDLATFEALQTRLDGDFTDAQRDAGGAFVYVDHRGDLRIERGYALLGAKNGADGADDDGVTRTETKPKPPITQKGTDDLHCISTLALQTALIDKSDLLLDLLAFQLEADHLSSWSAPLNITAAPQNITPSDLSEIHVTAKLDAQLTEIAGTTPADQFASFQALGKKHRNTVLARHLARAANAPMRNAFGKWLMAQAGANMRKVWTPTAANFLGQCSVPMLDALWAQLLELEDDDPRRAEFAKLKKGKKAEELEGLFMDASVQEAHG